MLDKPATRAINHREVDLGDGSLAVASTGEGPPLILLHGWTLDWRMWTPQIGALAAQHTLVMPDRRGFGRSSAPPDLARETDDIARLADEFGFDRFALLGLSQGAAIALDYAQGDDHRLSALVASGAPIEALVPRAETLDIARFERWASDGDLDAIRSEWLSHPLMRRENPETAHLVGAILADYDARDLAAPSRLPPPRPDALANLSIPVLAMTGSGDTPWRRACARALADTVPQGSFALVEGAGHLANLDRPDSFNRTVRGFLADHAH